MALSSVLEVLRFELVSNFLRYFLVAGAFFLVFWVAGVWPHRRIQPRKPPASRLRAEFLWSMSTVGVFSLVGLLTTGAIRAGWTSVYADLGHRGWPWFAVSLVLMTVLHDAYFYWTHRLLHHPALFTRVHRLHHLSVTPSPWAAYAFHPLEALVQVGIFPLIVFTIPAHPLALFLFLLYMILRNVIGHLGVEIFPAGFASDALTRWNTTPTHHDLHHRWNRGNYGLYFAWWDALMKTEHPDYRRAFAEVTSRPLRTKAGGAPLAAGRTALLLAALSLTALRGEAASETPEGVWHTIDDRSGTPRAIVRVTVEGDRLVGKIEGLFTSTGEDKDAVCGRCRGDRRGQPVIGMTMLWGHRPDHRKWVAGRVLDPENGKEYSSSVWLDGEGRLKVRGHWGPFFRTQTWRRAPEGASVRSAGQ